MPTANRVRPLAVQIAAAPRRHDNDYPLWAGPCGVGPLGGITQSMLVRFLSCRERFRLKYVLGLEPADKWVKTIGYGNMWHVCEEAHAAGDNWMLCLQRYAQNEAMNYRMQQDDIAKWFSICMVQFPEYVKYWSEHPDVINRKPLMQEQVFDVPYTLPSGRVVRLRGKFDSVDLITDDVTGPQGGVYLQENKSKGDIDKLQVERQLKFDIQTMLYLVALEVEASVDTYQLIRGVRYNVVRRPLSGGVGNIHPHKAKATKTKMVPAETGAEFYERLRRDYIADDPAHWFFRVRAEVSERDIQVFCETCLDPLLEQLCWWYEEVCTTEDTWTKNNNGSITQRVNRTGSDGAGTGMVNFSEPDNKYPPMNYRTPFGVWSALEEGGSTEYDAYLATGSEAGLRRVETLFTELQ